MSLRELWDTVVLRDILGYIFPGAVTLLALAVLLTRPGVDAWSMLGTCSNKGITGLFTTIEEHPLLLFPVSAASYAIGHLQVWIIEWLENEKKVPIWNNGKLALAFLRKERMGKDYARAGLRLSKLRETSGFADEPMMQHLSKANKDEVREIAGRQAEEIWRLCDRYVLRKDKDMHGMFIGRHYVLAVLFTNLGISLIVISVCVLLVYLMYDPVAALLGACILTLLMILLAATLLKQPPTRGEEKTASTKRSVIIGRLTILVATLLSGVSPFAWPVPGAALLPLGVGVLMVMRSSHFRKRFVECTFPIFYAIVQDEERTQRRHV